MASRKRISLTHMYFNRKFRSFECANCAKSLTHCKNHSMPVLKLLCHHRRVKWSPGLYLRRTEHKCKNNHVYTGTEDQGGTQNMQRMTWEAAPGVWTTRNYNNYYNNYYSCATTTEWSDRPDCIYFVKENKRKKITHKRQKRAHEACYVLYGRLRQEWGQRVLTIVVTTRFEPKTRDTRECGAGAREGGGHVYRFNFNALHTGTTILYAFVRINVDQIALVRIHILE